MMYTFNERECAFCDSEVQDGAIVCAHCGAYRGMKKDAEKGFFWTVMFGLILAAFGVFCVVKESEGIWGVLGFSALVPTGLLWSFFMLRDGLKPAWLRRN